MEAEVKRLGPRVSQNFKFPKARRLDEQNLVYPLEPELVRLAVHYLRTPSRALWDIFQVHAHRLEPLYDELKGLVAKDQRHLFDDETTISVEVKNVDAFEAGPLQVRGTVKNAIIEGAAERGLSLEMDPEDPDLVISVKGIEGGLLISIDLAGQALHLRGWRLAAAKAALKENLAAQMLILSRWDARKEPLIDPMAGTGTIVAEAALAAVGRKRWIEPRAPRLPPAFRSDEPLIDLFPGTEPTIIANEHHESTYDKLQANLQRAGVEEQIQTFSGDFADLKVPSGGLILTNPPFGVRLEADEGLYRRLFEWARGTGCRVGLLSGNPALEDVFGHYPRMKKPLNNGSVTAYFLLYDALR